MTKVKKLSISKYPKMIRVSDKAKKILKIKSAVSGREIYELADAAIIDTYEE